MTRLWRDPQHPDEAPEVIISRDAVIVHLPLEGAEPPPTSWQRLYDELASGAAPPIPARMLGHRIIVSVRRREGPDAVRNALAGAAALIAETDEKYRTLPDNDGPLRVAVSTWWQDYWNPAPGR